MHRAEARLSCNCVGLKLTTMDVVVQHLPDKVALKNVLCGRYLRLLKHRTDLQHCTSRALTRAHTRQPHMSNDAHEWPVQVSTITITTPNTAHISKQEGKRRQRLPQTQKYFIIASKAIIGKLQCLTSTPS